MNFEFNFMPAIIAFFVIAALAGAGVLYVFEHINVDISITKDNK